MDVLLVELRGVLGTEESDREPLLDETTCSGNPVHVGFEVDERATFADIETRSEAVDDETHVRDIDTSAENIRGDEDVVVAALEVLVNQLLLLVLDLLLKVEILGIFLVLEIFFAIELVVDEGELHLPEFLAELFEQGLNGLLTLAEDDRLEPPLLLVDDGE